LETVEDWATDKIEFGFAAQYLTLSKHARKHPLRPRIHLELDHRARFDLANERVHHGQMHVAGDNS
jgi:hypothetical protein